LELRLRQYIRDVIAVSGTYQCVGSCSFKLY